ncbi:hypothetical protein MWH25_05485 [Natroniella acetigena]|uniref:hypothetical protein n=1 Tax=Natroniella acetigena TaxID=52004 RepID=UPI00200A281A|nr:hypothetical protein [Natroniella acetigena]MCK8827191.1 hypothetical protein [Natroniella acetigena]
MDELQEKLKNIAELTGIDPELLNELDIQNLTEEKIELIEKIFNLYLTDQESFAEFITNSGLNDIANNLDEDVKEGIKDKDNLNALKDKLEDIIEEKQLNLDLDS